MLLLYNLFIRLYSVAVHLASLWNKKAALWVSGRKNLFAELETKLDANGRYVWMHCSSAGEFEQGKPVAEALKETYPRYKLLVTFFSPSGFEAAKAYGIADVVCYLPLDTRKNAAKFISLVKPELVLFVKYEFWYHHLTAAAFHHIPLLLISAVFRKDQIFFKRHGGFFRQMLHSFRQIFVQDEASLQLLQTAGISDISLGGDTRFDRVSAIQKTAAPVPFIEDFISGQPVVVAGSTWADDERLLKDLANFYPNLKLIIAPHEINEPHQKELQALFPTATLYSALQKQALLQPVSPVRGPNWLDEEDFRKSKGKLVQLQNAQVLLIDGVGLLSRLYQHATITYVGGGFTKDGIHNILEAAVWGKPVLFGPNYKKYREAKELLKAGGGFSVGTAPELKTLAAEMLLNAVQRHAAGEKAKHYVEANTGATEKLLEFIQENRLLTN